MKTAGFLALGLVAVAASYWVVADVTGSPLAGFLVVLPFSAWLARCADDIDEVRG